MTEMFQRKKWHGNVIELLLFV